MCVLQIGVYNEPSLQRLDLILAEAGKNGVRIIFPFVNYWPDLGGMQWYVDQVSMQVCRSVMTRFPMGNMHTQVQARQARMSGLHLATSACFPCSLVTLLADPA